MRYYSYITSVLTPQARPYIRRAIPIIRVGWVRFRQTERKVWHRACPPRPPRQEDLTMTLPL